MGKLCGIKFYTYTTILTNYNEILPYSDRMGKYLFKIFFELSLASCFFFFSRSFVAKLEIFNGRWFVWHINWKVCWFIETFAVKSGQQTKIGENPLRNCIFGLFVPVPFVCDQNEKCLVQKFLRIKKLIRWYVVRLLLSIKKKDIGSNIFFPRKRVSLLIYKRTAISYFIYDFHRG